MSWKCARAIGIVAAVAIAVFVVANQLGTGMRIDAYEVLDDDTILIHTIEGDLSWTRVTRVVETPDTVDITVKSFQAPVPVADVGYPAHFVVDLKSPLGDRHVLDRSAEVPLAP